MAIGKSRSEQIKKFKAFLLAHAKYSRQYESPEHIKSAPPEYDIYMTGSDQVWNPKYVHDDTTFMLDFITDESKPKIAYGASFGASRLSTEQLNAFKPWLSKYDHILCKVIDWKVTIEVMGDSSTPEKSFDITAKANKKVSSIIDLAKKELQSKEDFILKFDDKDLSQQPYYIM